MLLNSTLRLGYLEADLQSTLKLERRPSTRGAPGSSPPLLPEGTKSPAQMRRKGSKERSLSQDPSRGRLDDRRSLSREGSKSKELSLDWTHVPHKEIHNDGPVMYSVSTPATNGPRSHQPHLVRTTRIEPTAYSKRRPPIPPKREIPREQITVTEKDLMRCGSDLKKLRECQIVQQEPVERTLPAPLPPPTPLELSFKSNLLLPCFARFGVFFFGHFWIFFAKRPFWLRMMLLKRLQSTGLIFLRPNPRQVCARLPRRC